MAGRNDRGWWAAVDLGCLAAGCAAMFFVAMRFDIPGRLFSAQSDATRLQQPMLLLGLIALSLVLFGYRRWREVTAKRADADRWAHRDALTGLPDRVVFQERLHAALERPGRGCVGVLVIDVDRFRLVNVNYGQRAGDDVLASVAQRLHAVLGSEDLLVRLAGDQFAVLCPNLYDGRHAEAVADRVRQGLVRPFAVEGEQLWLTACIGVAVDDGGGESVGSLLRDAEHALERAQASGPGHHLVLDRSTRAAGADRHDLVQRLRAALRLGQFRLRYQPLVSTTDGHMVGVEALLRWEDPLQGQVQPDDFIPALEESGLIVSVGAWVLEEACRQAATWRRSGPPAAELGISVNVAPRQLAQPDFAATVARALEVTGANPRQLCLEITEAALIEDVDTARRELGKLRDLGVRLAVDDFGTGYSSVGYVRQFPLDSVKIDKSFVQGLTAGAEDAAIAQAIIKMAHAMGMTTVAEGVESAAELARLQQLGCDLVQGFYFSAPLTADAVDGLLRAGREVAVAS
ncbi:MAG: bifunctional diguanylate cyclase/phosphodiesterase [Actinobacteria bacterium]|nr:MAG: bifunctional diguanylate cyclase/phosphodiesterase [Actinomycetota bacterium]